MTAAAQALAAKAQIHRLERGRTALFLGEVVGDLNEGASFLDRLSAGELEIVRGMSRAITVGANEPVFLQGDRHEGIYLIEAGLVRTYHTGPSGREITLAYWTPGHFVGGPEVFGGGTHTWSGMAMEPTRLRYLTGATIRSLVERMPSFAVCLIEGLVAKGKCYSALVQMLGTRSVAERLAQLLVILGDLYGRSDGNRLVVQRKITHEQLALIVGATRQWVTMTLDRLQKRGIISVTRQCIVIEQYDLLQAFAGKL